MDNTGPARADRLILQKLDHLIAGGSDFDLRRVVEGSSPEDADELSLVLREYGRYRRNHGEVADFEEFRRAIPWLFDSQAVLQAAVETVLESALLLGRDHFGTARALTRAHPLAAGVIAAALEQWSDRPYEAASRDSGVRLPADFGPECLDGLPRYRLLSRVGSGPNGDVFQAIDREAYISEASGTVAVKVLNRQKNQTRLADRLIGWVESTRHVRTPGICHCIDAGIAPSGELYLVSRLAAGYRPIDRSEDRGRASARRAARMVMRAASSLEPLHTLGLAHGWLKPTNMLVSSDEQEVLMTDLGLSPLRPETLDACGAYTAGAALAFLAPELLSDEVRPNPASDLYSLGGILYWLISGSYPNGSNAQEAHSLLMDRASCARAYPHGTPRELILICEKALAIDPLHRTPSLTEFRRQLESWLKGRPIEGISTGWARYRRRVFVLTPAILVSMAIMTPVMWTGHQLSSAELRREHAALSSQYAFLADSSAEQIRMVNERAATVERLTNQNLATSHQAIDAWVKSMTGATSKSSPLPTALFDVVASLPIATEETRRVLLPQSAEAARYNADRFAGQQTMEALLWDLTAGIKLHEIGDDACTPYLVRARQELVRMGRGSDPWLAAIDAVLAMYRSDAGPGQVGDNPPTNTP
jgi:serine/threonine protein kinase